MKAVIAGVLSAILLLGLPIVGAVGGAWGAVVYAMPEPEPEPEADGKARCGMWWMTRLVDQIGAGLSAGFIGLVGLTVGLGAGIAVAVPTVRALSEWSSRDSLINCQLDE